MEAWLPHECTEKRVWGLFVGALLIFFIMELLPFFFGWSADVLFFPLLELAGLLFEIDFHRC